MARITRQSSVHSMLGRRARLVYDGEGLHCFVSVLPTATYDFAAELGKPRTDYAANEVGAVADILRLAQAAGVRKEYALLNSGS